MIAASGEPQALAEAIRDRWDLTPRLVEGQIRLEQSEGHSWMGRLFQEFGDRIDSVTVGKPTLEDVFIQRTGHEVSLTCKRSPLNVGERWRASGASGVGSWARRGQPLVFWLLFGVGLQGSFRPAGLEQGPTYLQYFFPGTLVLVLLFTAIFSTISIIEDRREGFLQSVLVAPAPRWAMVLGKVLGGSAIRDRAVPGRAGV